MGNSPSSPTPSTNNSYSIRLGNPDKGTPLLLKNPKYTSSFILTPYEGLSTMDACFLRSFKENPHNKCLGTRTQTSYTWKTYQEVYESALDLGSSLIAHQSCPKSQNDGFNVGFLGIYMINCEQWHIAEVACAFYDICTVPLYDTLGELSIEFILAQTQLHTILTSGDKLAKLVKMKKEGKTGALRNIILISQPSGESEAKSACEVGLALIDFNHLLSFGKQNRASPVPAAAESMYTLSYTSGTTGSPKGVIMTHKNLVSQIAGVFTVFVPQPDDVHLSYLPLAHLYERLAGAVMLFSGGAIGYYSGNVIHLKEDLSVLKPTLFVAVPRVLNRFNDLIRQKVAHLHPLFQKVFKKALDVKKAAMASQSTFVHGFYDKLVFNKIKNVLGGNVRLAVTASAPIASEVLDFLKVCFSCQILEAYGLTECGGACTASRHDDVRSGHVGGPLGCASLKLISIPDMNYFITAENPCGEICVKGPTVMSKYFRNPDATAEAIDAQAWLHTGDVAMLMKNGTLRIIDRKKNIYKLSQGEYVAPEKIENVYVKSRFVAMAFVYGDSMRDYNVAIIVPDREALLDLANDLGIKEDWESLCSNKTIISAVQNDIKAIGAEAGLNSIEQVKKIHLHGKDITPDSGLLTPTLKIKRYDMKNFFNLQINQLYSTN